MRSLQSLSLLVLCLLVAACHRDDNNTDAAATAEQQSSATANTVELKPEEVAKLGITTAPAQVARFTPEQSGYGQVLSHDVIAQLLAEISTAEAAVQQSHATLARAQKLANTPGAYPAETLETAQRQAAADDAALTLARHKLTASLGSQAGDLQQNRAALNRLASGELKLLRFTFPLGAAANSTPHTISVTRIDNSSNQSWSSDHIWQAPVDVALPGRSYFALLTSSDLSEGERVQVWTPDGKAQPGVLIPSAAVITSDGKWWCYVARQSTEFVRVPVDTAQSMDGGYFVTSGVQAGDRLVTSGAALLLARELNPSTEAE